VRTDEKFATIYNDDRHFATWVRLLIAADGVWPEPADVPLHARKASLRALADAGILDLLQGGMFRIHGLDKERGARRKKAQANVRARYDRTTAVDIPYYDRTTSRAEPSQDKPSRDARARLVPEPPLGPDEYNAELKAILSRRLGVES
jgi:hypothetical protein